MLDNGLQLVQRLVEPGLLRLQRVHLRVQRRHIGAVRDGEGGYPAGQQRVLPGGVGAGLEEGGDVAGEALAQIVDEAHAHHLVHVQRREVVPEEVGHQCQTPAMLRHAFPAAPGGVAVAGGVLQLLGGVQDLQQFGGLHRRILLCGFWGKYSKSRRRGQCLREKEK